MDEGLDLTSDPDSGGAGDARRASRRPERRYVGVQFGCCGTYARIYINRKGTAYEGCCPKCSRPVRLRIGPEGTDRRFFTAY